MSKFRISVSDPQKIGEGYSAYVSYKLTSSLSEKIPGLDSQVYSVIRRFNDFSWLRSQIRDALPYLIVPALPEKQQIGRFSEDFIAVRHRALQRWVDRISVHPEITSTGKLYNAKPFAFSLSLHSLSLFSYYVHVD
jgi:sorting nexin-1/2